MVSCLIVFTYAVSIELVDVIDFGIGVWMFCCLIFMLDPVKLKECNCQDCSFAGIHAFANVLSIGSRNIVMYMIAWSGM